MSFVSQNSKNAQGLVGLRNLGNTVSTQHEYIHYCTKRLAWKIFITLIIYDMDYWWQHGCSLFPQCFMNSILQCLSNTHDLRDYCLRNTHRTDLNNNSRAKAALMEGMCTSSCMTLSRHRIRGGNFWVLRIRFWLIMEHCFIIRNLNVPLRI